LPARLCSSCFCHTSISSIQWNSLVDEFLDQELFPNNPTLATQLGVHDFDAKVEDFSRSGIEKHIASLKSSKRRTAALDPKGLSQMETADREMLLSAIRSELLSLQVIRTWERSGHLSTGADHQHWNHLERQQLAADGAEQHFAVGCLHLAKTLRIESRRARFELFEAGDMLLNAAA